MYNLKKNSVLIQTLYISLLIIVFISNNTFAVNNLKDTSKIVYTKASYDLADSFFIRNLDSLTNLFYVKQSIALKHTDSLVTYDSSFVNIKTPDSVFIDRLASLPSVLELTYNDKVKAFLNVYTNRKKENVQIMLGLTDYYFPIFEQILDEYNLPHELKYLPVIESALNPRAVSRAGATGLWQFMYSTGKMYDLEINSYVDDRRDPIKASYAAARFLRDLYQMFGDWTLVIAAYNCGPGNVKKAIRRTGGKTNYWDIYYRLPRETRGYVPAFIAASYAMNYYEHHNLIPTPINLPLATDTILINQELHLKQVADVLGIDIALIRDLNPQYKRDIIPAKSKSYILKLPINYIDPFIVFEDSIFTYKDEVYFNPATMKKAPKSYTYSGAPPPKNGVKIYYTVKEGDNVGYIAEWYDVRASDLRYWNNISRNLIRVGQKLVVYVPKNKKSKYTNINSLDFASKQKLEGKTVKSEKTSTKQKSDNSYVYYTVRRGDNLWDIAKKYNGVSHKDIKALNNISDTKSLSPGQKLKIKKKS